LLSSSFARPEQAKGWRILEPRISLFKPLRRHFRADFSGRERETLLCESSPLAYGNLVSQFGPKIDKTLKLRVVLLSCVVGPVNISRLSICEIMSAFVD
jgi:hypothetical protein